MVNQTFIRYKWNGFLRRCFFYFGAFLLVDWVVKFELQFEQQQAIGKYKKHLRKKPFYLYSIKFWFTIGSVVYNFI